MLVHGLVVDCRIQVHFHRHHQHLLDQHQKQKEAVEGIAKARATYVFDPGRIIGLG